MKAKAKADPKAKAASKAWQSATAAEKPLKERVPLLRALDLFSSYGHSVSVCGPVHWIRRRDQEGA